MGHLKLVGGAAERLATEDHTTTQTENYPQIFSKSPMMKPTMLGESTGSQKENTCGSGT